MKPRIKVPIFEVDGQKQFVRVYEDKMACFLESEDNLPDYLTLVVDWQRIKAEAATEALEEYLVTNRFGFAPDRIDVSDPIDYSINYGYKANVKCLYYNYESAAKRKFKIVTKDILLKYDFLPTAGLSIPIVRKSVADTFLKHCGQKIQIIDVVITLKNGEEITDYQAINVINRVEAFTWEGSEKGMYYEEYSARFKEYLAKGLDWLPNETRIRLEKEKRTIFEKYGYPNAITMDTIAYRKEIIDREIICKDSITKVNITMISNELVIELKKHKFKGLGLYISYGTFIFI
jgi:hypothetical protein